MGEQGNEHIVGHVGEGVVDLDADDLVLGQSHGAVPGVEDEDRLLREQGEAAGRSRGQVEVLADHRHPVGRGGDTVTKWRHGARPCSTEGRIDGVVDYGLVGGGIR